MKSDFTKKHGNGKLTFKQVELAKQFLKEGISKDNIAIIVGVSRATIYRILK